MICSVPNSPDKSIQEVQTIISSLVIITNNII